jgi:hypothetical protein
MLAIPASAFALTGSASNDDHVAAAASGQAPVSLRARVTPRRIHLHHPVTVTGMAPQSDVGRWAILEAAAANRKRWHYLGSNQIGPAGVFRLRVRLRSSGFVRVIDAGVRPTIGPSSTAPEIAASGIEGRSATSQPLAVSVAGQLRVARSERNLLGGRRLLVAGKLLPGRAGRKVRLQGHFAKGWRTLAGARTGRAGGFALRYFPGSGLRRHLRVQFAGDAYNGATRAAAGAFTVYSASVASWYNDAGNTACGFHAGLGVANRTLPCGTKVTFLTRGRRVTATVDDRGPFVAGRSWDLNQNTAAALGFNGVGTVWVAG